jgi:chaperonin cofactor prefoldin
MKTERMGFKSKRRWISSLMLFVVLCSANTPAFGLSAPVAEPLGGPCDSIASELVSLKLEKQTLAADLQGASPGEKAAIVNQIKALLPKIAAKEKALRECSLLHDKNPVTKRVGKILIDRTLGDVGLYLKQVDGPVLAALNQNQVFEPASAIKALLHLHAMRQVENNSVVKGSVVTLNRQIPWFTNSSRSDDPATPTDERKDGCPADTGAANEPLTDSLRQMMMASDNRRTQAIRVFFGEANINATAQAAGMTSTSYNHRDGCANGPDAAIAEPNNLTLADAGRMYEGVARGTLLGEEARDTFYSLMNGGTNSGVLSNIQNIVNQEAPPGTSNAVKQAFMSRVETRFKPGSYGLPSGNYRAIAGWVRLPWRRISFGGNNRGRQYVYGVFVARAPDGDKASAALSAATAELLREQIREALKAFAR